MEGDIFKNYCFDEAQIRKMIVEELYHFVQKLEKLTILEVLTKVVP